MDLAVGAALLESRISPYMTQDEVAGYLRVSTRTVKRWVHDGKLPATRLSQTCVRIRRRDVETFVEANAVRIT